MSYSLATDLDTRTYDFHGVRICLACDGPVANAVFARFEEFRQVEASTADITIAFRRASELDGDQSRSWTATGRPVYESAMGRVAYDEVTDELAISATNGLRMVCYPEQGRAEVLIPPERMGEAWLLSHPFVTLPLLEMLKRRGRYSIHAAGIAVADKGLLFPGTSGAGKSTLTLTMARAGFGFLGDDMLFLSHTTDRMHVLAFPDEIDVTDDSARLFPELGAVLASGKASGWPKHQVRAPEHFGSKVIWECRPAALVFPRVAHRAESIIEPMNSMEALLELAPNVLLTEARSAQAHLDALAELVETCDCYRMETGRDIDALPNTLAALVR